VSITRQIIEGVQTGFSRLTSLVIVDDEPLSHVEAAALQAELVARKAAREKSAKKPGDTPLAKMAVSDPSARSARDRAAKERAGRIHRERDAQAARTRAAADEAFRRMKEQAARGASYSSTTSSSSSGSSSGTRCSICKWARTWRRSSRRTAR
jgi:hypothetical protein